MALFAAPQRACRAYAQQPSAAAGSSSAYSGTVAPWRRGWRLQGAAPEGRHRSAAAGVHALWRAGCREPSAASAAVGREASCQPLAAGDDWRLKGLLPPSRPGAQRVVACAAGSSGDWPWPRGSGGWADDEGEHDGDAPGSRPLEGLGNAGEAVPSSSRQLVSDRLDPHAVVTQQAPAGLQDYYWPQDGGGTDATHVRTGWGAAATAIGSDGSGGGDQYLGTLTYVNRYLYGARALWAAIRFGPMAATGGLIRLQPNVSRPVQLHARMLDGQYRAYDVVLYVYSGLGACRVQNTRLLARDLCLRNGDRLALALLPDGRLEVAPLASMALPAPDGGEPAAGDGIGDGIGYAHGSSGGQLPGAGTEAGAAGCGAGDSPAGGGGSSTSSGERGAGAAGPAPSGAGHGAAAAVGALRYCRRCLTGKAALALAFPQQTGTYGSHHVRLYGLLPGEGRLQPYDLVLYNSYTTCRLQSTRLLVRDLGLNDGDLVELSLLPDGGAVLEAAGCATAPRRAKPQPDADTLRVNRASSGTYLYGAAALQRAFPAEPPAMATSRRVMVWGRLPCSNLWPYTLRLAPVPPSSSVALYGVGMLVNDLGLQHGDEALLSALPDGRVVLEPRCPRPVDPNAIALTGPQIVKGLVSVPLRIVARLLGEERARHGSGPGGVPVKLSGDGEVQGRLVAYLYKSGRTVWYVTGLSRWLRACGASPGDTLRLEVEAGAAEALPAATEPPASGEAAPAAAATESCARPLVARLVRAGEDRAVEE